MDVVQAVYLRSSIRQFLPDPVDDDTLRSLLEDAARAPSGGNVQPWRIYVVNGESMGRLQAHLATQPAAGAPEYDIYPPDLWEPYRTNRFAIGEEMYSLLGIAREDKDGRRRQFARNEEFFGAPAGLFCFIDRRLGRPQWADLGMFLQTLMLLAVERGLATCAQEFWSLRHGAVSSFVQAPPEEMLFCGMAIGYADASAPVNALRSTRMPLDQWARFV
ncbi:MAG: nitroreductase [Actinomycetota bacterium]|nr:nitroreductase [Actinomycetota bacterium]